MSIHVTPQIIPVDAPFSAAQRTWLNRFFADALLKLAPLPDLAPAAPVKPAEDDSTP